MVAVQRGCRQQITQDKHYRCPEGNSPSAKVFHHEVGGQGGDGPGTQLHGEQKPNLLHAQPQFHDVATGQRGSHQQD